MHLMVVNPVVGNTGSSYGTKAMEVIPAIDLLGGACVRLQQGDYGRVTRFSNDPVATALQWQQQGATRLHLVDLDGAKAGQPLNDSSVKAIVAALRIPVQLGGGVRTVERAEAWLACGVERVILGTVAIDDPQVVYRLAKAHPGRVVVGIDARNGRVATQGWTRSSAMAATTLAQQLEGSGVAAIVSTDIASDGTMAGPNVEALQAMAAATTIPLIASGGVGSLEHLQQLLPLAASGVKGVIVGRALYDGRIALADAIRCCSAGFHLSSAS